METKAQGRIQTVVGGIVAGMILGFFVAMLAFGLPIFIYATYDLYRRIRYGIPSIWESPRPPARPNYREGAPLPEWPE